jgi:WD40 repeat protein
MYHLQAIEAYPLQVYVSALLFSPTQSLIRNAFEHEEPSHFTIKPTLRDSWGACLQTLTIGEYDKIRCVAFSPNSRLLACTIKRTVNIYNATSGARLQTIEHSNSKKGVAFLSESLLAVASEGNLIRIWDLTIGVCLKALEGHEDVVNDVAFSGSQLASASRDGTVKIWDTTSGACLRTLADNSCAVTMVAFSSNLVAASSIGRITKIWNADSGMCVFTLHTNVYTYTSLAFSPDSTQLALTLDESVEIWDVNNGTCLQKLVGHTDTVHSVIFSRDATWLASASADRTVKIWSPSGTCLQTFTDHVVGVHLVALSHDSTFLASASSDGAVKLWDTSSVGVCDKNATGHNEAVSELVFLRDFTWLASLSRDRTVKIWDSNTGACLQTLEGFESHTIQIGSGNSTRLVILLWNKCVEIWDTDSSSASYSRKLTILSDWSPAWFPCVSLSHDSSRLASSVDSVEGDISILDISGNGASHLRTFEHAFNSEFIRKLAFSHDATKLASLSLTSIIIWDVISGVRIHKFDTDRHVANVAFNATGSYVHIGHSTISTSPPYDVVSLDRPEHPLYPSAGYSENGEWITYGGKNVLWMPTAYRSYFKIHCISPCGRKVAVGTKSGEVWIVNFNPRSSDELDSRDSGTRLKVC